LTHSFQRSRRKGSLFNDAGCNPLSTLFLIRYTAWLLGLLLLAACSSLPPAPNENLIFDATGRFSGNAPPGESFSGRFNWQETSQGSDITLSSPLGNTLARLVVRPQQSELQLGQETQTATQPEALLERYLKVSLPVSGLKYWLQGTAKSGIPQAPNSFSEDGWQIEYLQMQDGKPRLISLQNLEQVSPIKVRLVIEQWQ
jgi:outer membrane lipoprotein LolB